MMFTLRWLDRIEDSISLRYYSTIGKILYGILFTCLLPGFLILWARSMEGKIPLPMIGSFSIGGIVAIIGATLMLFGMAALFVYGNGLPMNPFPPSRYVTEGIYKFTPHPIYTGFAFLCIGVSIAVGSPSGLWIISPTVILSCVALVIGFEKHDLRQRFGQVMVKPLIHLPDGEIASPVLWDRISVYILVFLPWLLLYEAVALIKVPSDAIIAFLPFEMNLPVLEWTEIFYISTYLFVLFTPWIVKTKCDLRKFSISAWLATGIIILIFLALPLIAPPRPFMPKTFLGKLLIWERRLDTPACAFPSFHVVWALLAAKFYTRSFPSWKFFWWGWAILIVLSCITTGMHALVDVVAGLILFWSIHQYEAIWHAIHQCSESIANSWKEWRLGQLRLINHGFYAGASAFIGLLIVGTLLGRQHIVSLLIVAFCSLITAALWAQFIEGSSSLLRPYGYYGGVIGIAMGSLIAQHLGTELWLLLAAFSIAGPWIQAAGRLRCLVQGCCHGRKAPEDVGIRYVHPRSRVSVIAGLSGIPIHSTPTYSILWNFVVGIILARLCSLHVAPPIITGVYLILAGFGRFVEEAYRGEPQTPVIGGLRLYQWFAAGSVVAGAFFTTLDHPSMVYTLQLSWESVTTAAGFGVFSVFALGVDFPNSNRRFSRLV